MMYKFFVTNTNTHGFSDLIIEHKGGLEAEYLPEAVYEIPVGRKHKDIMGHKHRVKAMNVVKHVTPDPVYREQVLDVVLNYVHNPVLKKK